MLLAEPFCRFYASVVAAFLAADDQDTFDYWDAAHLWREMCFRGGHVPGEKEFVRFGHGDRSRRAAAGDSARRLRTHFQEGMTADSGLDRLSFFLECFEVWEEWVESSRELFTVKRLDASLS